MRALLQQVADNLAMIVDNALTVNVHVIGSYEGDNIFILGINLEFRLPDILSPVSEETKGDDTNDRPA